MPIQVVWDNSEKTIIRLIVEGKLTLSEYYEATRTQNEMMDSVPHLVDNIFDLTAAITVPNFLSAARYMETAVRPNERGTILVNAPRYVVALVEVGKRVAPRALGLVMFANTLDDAYALIAQQPDPLQS